MSVSPPSSFLPTIRAIASTPPEKLHQCMVSLREIYNPPVRGTRRRSAGSRRLSIGGMTDLRADKFELSYVLTWLTALLSRQSEVEDEEEDGHKNEERRLAEERLVTEASQLLALCAGTSAAGTIERMFEFSASQVDEGNTDAKGGVSVQLRDVPLDNDDYGSVGAQTWGGACVLSEMVVEDPKRFGLTNATTPPSPLHLLLQASSLASSTVTLVDPEAPADKKFDDHSVDASIAPTPKHRPLRILELGAGTGLVSIVVSKVLQGMGAGAEIIASDYYPSVLANLARNITANRFTGPNSRVTCSAYPLDWSLFPSSSTTEGVFAEPFDLVFGADIIYELQHAQWIKSCLELLLAKPGSSPTLPTPPSFYLLFPLRETHTAESQTIEAVFPFHKDAQEEEDQLRIHEKELIVCDTDTGEEVVYVYYRIGW